MPVLIKFQKDWADEFDVYGFQVLSDKEWAELQEAIDKIKYPLELYFGTNEQLIFESSDETLRELKATFLNLGEYLVFKKHFGTTYSDSIDFGWNPIDQILDSYSGQKSDDELDRQNRQ